MGENYDGKKLAKCFEVASATWKEIDSLAQILNKIIEESLSKNGTRYEKEKRIAFCMDDTDWIGTDVAQSFGIFQHRGKKPNRFLGYQVSVLGDGMLVAEEPLVHFVCWNYALSFDDGIYVGFPFDEEPPTKVESDRLIWWTEDGLPQWMFSVRLTFINDEASVARIAHAMIALLQEKPLEEALPSSLPGLVLYHLDGDTLKVIN